MEKYTLITGGSAGIGLELAKLFAKDGHNLILVSRSQANLEEAKRQVSNGSINVLTISKDLFEENGAQELYDEIKAKGLEVETLVNDAGQGSYGKFIETDLQKELKIIHLNINSLVTLTKLFLKDFAVKGAGKILNVSSMASKSPGPYQAVYHGTKAFVQSFTEAIRSEVKDDYKDITITALLPGITDTDFFIEANMQDSKALQDKSKMSNPADVAKDGYEALIAGKDMVVSGFGNKVQAAMAGLVPDILLAEKVKKMQEPVEKDKK